MNFQHSIYLIPVIILIAILWYRIKSQEKLFFSWVEDHWFYKQSMSSKIASFSMILGISFLLLALLDLRGPEKRIEGKVSNQKTIILIDSSASMLAEDVRPNRFKKAIVLAKHYVKRAVGQQISIVVFSDSAKQIMPFTNDVDLLEARLGALENMSLGRGGTSLTLGITESIQFFKNHTSTPSGNILVFTDAEETDGGIETDIPEEISVGVIGVGTAKGAVIPMRNKRGGFIGNKKYKGKAIISKLDEKFIRSLGERIKDFKYWIATSYTLPTEEIINFFTKIHNLKMSKNSFRIKPVLSNYLMVPGVILLIISFLFRMRKSFILPLLILFSMNSFPQESMEKPKKEKSSLTRKLEEKFKKGNINKEEKKALASLLLKEGFTQEAESLYDEITDKEITNENFREQFNKGAAQFKNKKIVEGFNTYKNLYNHLKENDPESELLPTVKANMLKALEQMASQSKSKKSQKNDDKNDEENKDQNDKNDKKDNKDGKSGKKQNDKNGKPGEQSDDNEKDKDNKKNEDGKDGDDKKEEDQGKDKNKNEKDKDADKKDKDKKSDKKGKPSDGKPKGKEKLPAILKQLMSDDNQLQKKMIDTGTTKPKTREKKDW